MILKTILKDCITGITGEDYDVGRILWIAGALGFLVLSVYHAWRHGQFDYMGYGTGYGGILAGGGAGIGMKAKTEPLDLNNQG